MTYSGFHLAFNLPVLLLLFFASGKGIWPGEVLFVMIAILGIVVAFTSPWDNWAVAKGIWDFPQIESDFALENYPSKSTHFS